MNGKQSLAHVFIIIVLLCGQTAARAQTLYAVSWNNEYLSIDVPTGAATLIGNLAGTMRPAGLAWRGNQLFTWANSTQRIVELDPQTGATLNTVDIGVATKYPTGAAEGELVFKSDGTGFLVLEAPDPLYQFDITVPNATAIGTQLGLTMDAMTLSPAGVLYAISTTIPSTGNPTATLYTIDPTTGVPTQVGSLGPTFTWSEGGGMVFDASGTLYAVLSGTAPARIYTVDTTTGLATQVSLLTPQYQITGVAVAAPSPGGTGVTVTQTSGSTAVAEGGASDSYDVVLTGAPSAPVTITLNPGSQLSVAPATLTFTPANWMTSQTVTVTAVDDSKVEGTHSGTIAHSAASTDTAYNGITINSVTVTITDNDSGGGPGPTPTPGKSGGFGEGAYWNTPGPKIGKEGASYGEGAYLFAALTPHLCGPFAVDAQGGLTPLPTAQLAAPPSGHALVLRSASPRRTPAPAEGQGGLAIALASAAQLLGGAIAGALGLGRS